MRKLALSVALATIGYLCVGAAWADGAIGCGRIAPNPDGEVISDRPSGGQHHQLADSTTYDVPAGASSSYGGGHDGDVASWAWPNNGRSRAKIVLSSTCTATSPSAATLLLLAGFHFNITGYGGDGNGTGASAAIGPDWVTTIDVPATSAGWKLNIETNNHMVNNGASCFIQLDGATRNVSFNGASTEVFSAIPPGQRRFEANCRRGRSVALPDGGRNDFNDNDEMSVTLTLSR